MNKCAIGASILAFSSIATVASAGVDMNHTDAFGSLVSTTGFGVNQRFETAFAANNSAVIDDFTASATNIFEVRVAFEESQAANHLLVTNWHLAIWNSAAAAAASGNSLTGNVIDVDLGPGATYTAATGAGGSTPTQAAFTGLNISGLVAGTTYWMGLVPDLAFGTGGQEFILSNTAPAVLGAGTNNTSVGVNPGGAFGLGTQIAVNTNAALYIRTGAVPEPASMSALGLGVIALIRRRRNKKA